MGYITGAGLGKKEQGIKEPIITNTNLGTRGFGLNLQNLQLSNEDWDFSREVITHITMTYPSWVLYPFFYRKFI